MSKFSLLVALVASLVVSFSSPAARAQGNLILSFVSSTGDNANDCSTPARACASFARAMNATADYGTIVCEGGTVGGELVTITKPITISCTPGSAPTIRGITVNVAAGAIRLRNLHLNGTRAGGIFANGIVISAAANVIIEDCVIENYTGFGIVNNHTGGGKLLIRNTTLQNNGTGVGLFPAAGDAQIDSSRIDNNINGIGVAGNARVAVSRSVLSGNFSSALVLDSGGVAIVDASTISSNSTGIQATSGATVLLSNNNIFLNTTAFSGTTLSYRNNQIQFSGIGTTPTALGSAQSPFGTM